MSHNRPKGEGDEWWRGRSSREETHLGEREGIAEGMSGEQVESGEWGVGSGEWRDSSSRAAAYMLPETMSRKSGALALRTMD